MKNPSRRRKRINKSYNIINLILAGIIMMVFIYSGLFSAQNHHSSNHPIPSFYEKISGEPSPSSGLSRAFSELIRGNPDSAREYNQDAVLLFSFFLIQLIMRILVFVLSYRQAIRSKYLLTADLAISIPLFLYCFKGQMISMGRLIFS